MTAGRTAGRRAGDSGTRETILAAARGRFAEHGYDGATIRAIAADAGVDPALVHHFFGSKEQLFVAAMRLPVAPSEILAALEPGRQDAGLSTGERLIRTALTAWDDPEVRGPFLGLLRSALTSEQAARMLREFVSEAILRPVAKAAASGRVGSGAGPADAGPGDAGPGDAGPAEDARDAGDAQYRAGMVASQVLGLAVTRFVLALGPVASASPDDLVATIGPTLQRYLTGEVRAAPAADRPAPGSASPSPGSAQRRGRVRTDSSGGPESYLHGHHESVLRAHRWRTVENSAGYLLPRLSPGVKVLDIGCGPGTITVGLAARVRQGQAGEGLAGEGLAGESRAVESRAGEGRAVESRAGEGQVVGIDVVSEVLADAQAEAVRQGCRNLSFQAGDVYRLAFGAGVFDVVHAHQVLQHLADPVAALTEMRRVCRPGGVVAARDADYGGMFWFPEEPGLRDWQVLYQRVARALDGEPDAGRRLLGWARAAGFEDVDVSASSWCFATAADRSWWGSLWAERVTKSNFADQAIGLGFATREDLDGLAAAWRRWAASDDGWFLIPHGEILCGAPAEAGKGMPAVSG